MSARLCITAGGEMREVLCEGVVTIGRVEDNAIVLPGAKVSRHHAMVRAMGNGSCFLVDTGSSNGTFVNGRRITVPYELAAGDTIEIGGNAAVFRSELDGAADASDTDSVVLAEATLLTVGGVVERITILVADVRGYTGLSSVVDPDDLGVIMGRLFAESAQMIEENGGVVDKFAGDAVMALWVGRDRHAPQTVRSAISAVLGIEKTIARINKEFPNLPSRLRMGFGLNNGKAVMGTFGPRHRREYTALGDAVNVAFRLEAATRTLNSDIVIGPEAYGLLDRSRWEKKLQNVVVKGKTDPIPVLALTSGELPPLIL